MVYTGRKTTNGYGVLVPWNNTAQKQWPKDTPNAVYQLKKTSSATNQGVEITGAVYAIFTNKDAADAANNKTYASAQAAKDAAPNGWIQIDKATATEKIQVMTKPFTEIKTRVNREP